jgi:hypothetical protein
LAGKNPEKTNCNIGNIHSLFILQHDWERKRRQLRWTWSWKRTELHWCQELPKSGLCAALGNNVFDYGHRAAADQMLTSWEKLVEYIGTNYRIRSL